MMGSILIMVFYYLGLFWLRRQDKSSLYFGLFCLTIALRAFIVDYPQWLGLSWSLFTQITFLLLYFGSAALMLFTHILFPQEFSKGVLNTTVVTTID